MGFLEDTTWGSVNPTLICPRCQTRGHVRTKLKRKAGIISKATDAVLTAAFFLLETGLSRKQHVAHCDNCNSDWDF
jgi:hypothetical protein